MSTHENDNNLPMDEIKMKIQALVDNELPETEIESTLDAIQGSYEYRKEYAELLKLRRRLAGGPASKVSEDWLIRAERKISRRISRGFGTLLMIGSYAVLIGYALFTLFSTPEVPPIISILVSAGILGFLVLLGNAIADRVRENKTDKYREIIR